MPNKSLTVVYTCLFAIGGCDAQVTPSYKGESLLTITGSVEIVSERNRGSLVPALAFQGRDEPLYYIMDVDVEGEFPSDFTLRVYEPPPEDAFFRDPIIDASINPPAIAFAAITAVTPEHPETITRSRLSNGRSTCFVDDDGVEGCEITETWCRDAISDQCYTETRLCPVIDSPFEDCEIFSASGDASLRQDQWAAFAGLSEQYMIMYLSEPVAKDDPARLYMALPALDSGYHLLQRKRTEEEEREISDSRNECLQEAETIALQRYNEESDTRFGAEEYADASSCVFDEECEPPEFTYQVDTLVVMAMDELDCWQYELWQPVDNPEKERISVRISPDVESVFAW